jgi:hypothetical protein
MACFDFKPSKPGTTVLDGLRTSERVRQVVVREINRWWVVSREIRAAAGVSGKKIIKEGDLLKRA